jgi:hypothetical protein
VNGVKGFSTPIVKVSEIRQMIHSGQFANWIKVVKLGQEQYRELLLALRQHRKTMKLLRELTEGKE